MEVLHTTLERPERWKANPDMVVKFLVIGAFIGGGLTRIAYGRNSCPQHGHRTGSSSQPHIWQPAMASKVVYGTGMYKTGGVDDDILSLSR